MSDLRWSPTRHSMASGGRGRDASDWISPCFIRLAAAVVVVVVLVAHLARGGRRG